MFRTLLIIAIITTVPLLIYGGLRRRLAYTISVTVTVYLILIGVRYLHGFVFFREELSNVIGVVAVMALIGVAGYAAVRYYSDRAVARKLEERRRRPEAHRTVVDNVRRRLNCERPQTHPHRKGKENNVALSINETPVHWDDVAPPARLPPWMEVVWIAVPRYPRRLWFLSKTGTSWQQRQREEIVRKGRDILLAERDATADVVVADG